MNPPHLQVLALWLVYAAATWAALRIARRFAGPIPWRAGLFLALAPLVFTGQAMIRGGIYGPADLYYGYEPWAHVASEHGVTRIANPILSDLAFANLPWRAAVREALANGRFPFWNRFVLAGNPLLGAAQAGIFHPSTWLAIFLPTTLSWTFSCAFTIFLALLAGFLFFLDFRLRPAAALAGAVGWGFSTYVLFFCGWSVGPSVAGFPLLLLGLRRLAAARPSGAGLTVTALLLALAGGHPETLFHSVAAGGVYFLWELFGPARLHSAPRRFLRPVGSALAAGLLALLLAGPQLLPLLEAIRHSAEYRARKVARDSGAASQSVGLRESAARLLPAVLPFAHGIYGKSPVQAQRRDGSGMPLGYAGAVLFALTAYGMGRRSSALRSPEAFAPPERGRVLFAFFLAAGLLFGASAPGLIDLVSRLPVFTLALNYRLVFLAPLGLAGLAAFGADRLCREESRRALAVVAGAILLALAVAFLASRGIFRERALPGAFVRVGFASEVVPLALLAAGALLFPRNGRAVLFGALLLLLAQRAGEMGGTYPTLAAGTLAPALPELSRLPQDGAWRVAAAGEVLRPNGAALYGLEDARGYESLVLDRFADTFPLWSKAQFASFNRVDVLDSPFLSFLNVRFAFGPPDAPAPRGWRELARGREMAVFENPRVLPRAFIPARLRFEADPERILSAMATASDFSESAWIRSEETGDRVNARAEVSVREVGPDLRVTVSAGESVFVATSLPDWPGWRGEADGAVPLHLVTVNHAFVGFWIPKGRHDVRLRYRPASFFAGLAALAAGLALSVSLGFRRRRPSG